MEYFHAVGEEQGCPICTIDALPISNSYSAFLNSLASALVTTYATRFKEFGRHFVLVCFV
jgi:hypothetical protein